MPATWIDDHTLVVPLRELETQIAQRADWLATKASAERPSWYLQLEQSSPLATNLVREIAAYRERYGIHSPMPLGAAPSSSKASQRHIYNQLLSRTRTERVPQTEEQPDSVIPAYEADR